MGVEQVEAAVAGVSAEVVGSELVRDRSDGWDEPRDLTAEQRQAFLEFVTANRDCSLKAASLAAGVRRRDVKRLLRDDVEFKEDYHSARGYSVEQIFAAATRLAIEGVEEPLVSAGKLVKDDDGNVVTVRKYSERMLQTLFNGMTPEGKAMLGHRLEITGADGGPVKVQSGVALEDVVAMLQGVGAVPCAIEEAPAGELVAETDEPVA